MKKSCSSISDAMLLTNYFSLHELMKEMRRQPSKAGKGKAVRGALLKSILILTKLNFVRQAQNLGGRHFAFCRQTGNSVDLPPSSLWWSVLRVQYRASFFPSL